MGMLLSRLTLSLIVVLLVLCISPDATAQSDISARWIWRNQDSCTKYNDTIVARKMVELPEATSAQLAITADTRYRLSINGNWIGDGPCRSWPDQYQYDVIEVTPHLKVGRNEIRIVAKYFGVGTFHQVPQQAGLLAQLDVQTSSGRNVRVITDETWEVAGASTWISNTVKRCIQMGPLEIYDARLEGQDSFAPAAVLFDAHDGPWKNLTPRDCRLMTRIPVALTSFREANIVNHEWRCYAFPTARLLYPGLIEANKTVSMASAVATVIDVAQAMTLHIDADGSTVTIDGQQGNNGAFDLAPGKHFLFAAVSRYFGHWEKDTEIRIHEVSGYALHNPIHGDLLNPWCWVPFEEAKYVNSDYQFAILGTDRKNRIESSIRDTIAGHINSVRDAQSFEATFGNHIVMLSSKDDVMEDVHEQFKAREVIESAGDLVQRPQALLRDDENKTAITPSPRGDIELVYDLGEENVGYFAFEFDAEPGLVVDVSAVEYITPDGRVQHTERYRNCMRYICKNGNNRFLSLDRRAARYVYITLRNQTKAASIRHFNLIESTYPVDQIGHFACSEAELNEIWKMSTRTLKLCMEDVYTDCPLYEQTLWAGDARNEGLYGLTVFGAEDITRRCAWLMAQSIGEYPIALCQTPSTWGTILPSEGFMWNISIWDYYAFSGDRAFLRKVWPNVLQSLRNSHELRDDRGLFSGPFWQSFDFADVDRYHETVLYNSMFLVGAIDAGLKCADALDDAATITWLTDFRKELVDAINSTWNDQRLSYPDSIHNDGRVSSRTCVHTNFLAYLYDIVEERNKEHVLRNMTDPPEGMVQVGSPFASMFLYEALEKAGRQKSIIDAIRTNYAAMLAAGATTVWESYPTGTLAKEGFPTRSYCHAFSSAPVYFLNRIVLGILPKGVGTKTVTISPWLSGLTWAEGASATTNGPVDVSWKLEGSQLAITADGPEGTTLLFQPNESTAHLEVVFNGRNVP